MKKILFLLLISVSVYSQPTNLQNPTYGTVKLKSNTATAETTKIVSQQPATGELNYINATALPISTAVQSSLDVKANDADVIHTTGDETKSGQLTLSNSLNLTNVEAPATLPTVTVNGAAGNLTGEYLYGVSYYTADGKDTGVPNITSVLTLSAGRVDISNIPISANPLVVGRRIYRTDPALGDYRAMRLVVQIADNTTTTYQDNIPDASLGAYPQWYNTTGGELKLNGNRVFSVDGQSFSIGRGGAPSNKGYANQTVGNYSGASLTYGYRNVLSGLFSGYSLTSGYENTATGVHSLNYNTTGKRNTAYGYGSLFKNTTGDDNVAFGDSALSENLTGSKNVAIGNFAGYWELGSDTFYVNNRKQTNTAGDVANSMFYGNFNASPNSQYLRINAKIGIGVAADSFYDLKVGGSSGTAIATQWSTSGGSYFKNGEMYMPFGGIFQFDVAGTKTTAFRYDSSGNFYLTKTPTTSAGTYDFLTRNTSTGAVEKIASNTIASIASPAFTGTPTAPTATVGTNTTQIATTAFVQAANALVIEENITDGVTNKTASQNKLFDTFALKAPLNYPEFTGDVLASTGDFITGNNYRLGSWDTGFSGSSGSYFRIKNPGYWQSNVPIHSTSFIKTGGLATEYLMADGSVTTGVGSVNTAFNEVTYSSTISHAFDSANPNIFIDVTGNLDLTYTGTVNGDSGMVNLYFAGTETATVNGTKSLNLTGDSTMIPIYFIHDDTGIRWYDGRDSSGGSQDLQVTLENGGSFDLGSTEGDILDDTISLRNITTDYNTYFEVSEGNTYISSKDNISNIEGSIQSYQGKISLIQSNPVSGGSTELDFENPTVTSTVKIPAPPTAGNYTLALGDGTILYHIATATTTGTVTSSGTNWTGTGTAITDNMVGAKITVDGQTTIIDTVNSGAQTFTTTSAIPATSEIFEVRCIASKVFSDGTQKSFHADGTSAVSLTSDKSVVIAGDKYYFSNNGNYQQNGYLWQLQDKVVLNGNGDVQSSYKTDKTIYTFATLPTFGSGVRVYASISDGGTPVYMTAAAGGGSTQCSVYWNGSIWLYH